ncbi:MAG: hypothetical protein SNG10_06865 [Rikenellaceae bacterium]
MQKLKIVAFEKRGLRNPADSDMRVAHFTKIYADDAVCLWS